MRNAIKAVAAIVLAAVCVVAHPARAQTAPVIPDHSAHILTPPAPARPRINGASVHGVRPGSPIIYQMPVTGERPLRYSAANLPEGVVFDAVTGRLSGAVQRAGTYEIALRAANRHGRARRTLRLIVGDTIALTPPMGWNSYNIWSDEVTQERALAAARAMVSSGLIDHGWSYINLDDGWQGGRGGPFNALQPDLERFPNLPAMVDEIHAMGLKVGLYSSPWVLTYANRLGGSAENPEGLMQTWPPGARKNHHELPFAIGRFHFTENDAQQFAAWGVDYLKYDWGPVEYPETREMYDALRRQDRDIVLSLSNNHVRNLLPGIGEVSTVANSWRTTTDITDVWSRVANDIGFDQDAWAPHARPGHYNDADMLVVGVVGWGQANLRYTRLTPDEQYTHVTLWALLASPLLLGNDLTQLDAFTLSLLTNDEVIGVNQDPLVQQARTLWREGSLQILSRRLEDGSVAVGLFNRGAEAATIAARWSDLGIAGPYHVRDLWRQRNLGRSPDTFSFPVAAHGAVFLRISQRRLRGL